MSATIKILAFILAVCAFTAVAQSNEQIERELVGHLKNIEDRSDLKGDDNGERLENEFDIFKTKLLKYTKLPATLRYEFRELDKYLYIATSDDGKFRAFSWNLQSGGTMHFFETVYQYSDAKGRVHSESRDLPEGDAGSFVHDVYTLETKSGKVYLLCSTAKLSSAYGHQSVRLFKIAGTALDDDVNIIKTKSGMTNTIGFEYDFFSIPERKDRPVKLISFDKKTKTLKVPVVVNDEEFPNGRVTNRFISYKFNGTNFIKVS
ncbi:MAG TPA: hypothetical protein VIL74_24010 [Pyrinomonadaceae bacterium]